MTAFNTFPNSLQQLIQVAALADSPMLGSEPLDKNNHGLNFKFLCTPDIQKNIEEKMNQFVNKVFIEIPQSTQWNNEEWVDYLWGKFTQQENSGKKFFEVFQRNTERDLFKKIVQIEEKESALHNQVLWRYETGSNSGSASLGILSGFLFDGINCYGLYLGRNGSACTWIYYANDAFALDPNLSKYQAVVLSQIKEEFKRRQSSHQINLPDPQESLEASHDFHANLTKFISKLLIPHTDTVITSLYYKSFILDEVLIYRKTLLKGVSDPRTIPQPSSNLQYLAIPKTIYDDVVKIKSPTTIESAMLSFYGHGETFHPRVSADIVHKFGLRWNLIAAGDKK